MESLRRQGVDAFFAYARERHSIYLRRREGRPPPWTDDPVLQENRFTNIFRELDRTTIWCRQNVRERYDWTGDLLPAVVLFRWFNKIETGEAIFRPQDARVPATYKNNFERWTAGKPESLAYMRDNIIAHVGPTGPFTNAAYIVKTPNGMTKLDGVLWAADQFLNRDGGCPWQMAQGLMRSDCWSLERSWQWMREHDHQGDFTAYEVVSDLRHTRLLRDAPDIMTWANAGPGAVRGANRVQGRPVGESMKKIESLHFMRELLEESRSINNWPRDNGDNWPRWEMRDVEHTLCEFDKSERVRRGEGKAKQRYDGKAKVELGD